jgi:two-component system C4-dicarboxylate transport sensor histidine kinase DctB
MAAKCHNVCGGFSGRRNFSGENGAMSVRAEGARAGRSALAVLALVALVVIVVIAAGLTARQVRLQRVSELAALQAERHAAQLETELARFDHLPEIIRFHPSVQALLDNPTSPSLVDEANRYLERVNHAAGSAVLYVLDRTGLCIASSNWRDITSFVGVDLSYRPYFRDTLIKGSQHFYGIGTTTGIPGYFFGRALQSPDGVRGVGVVKVEKWHAAVWPGAGRMMVVDGNGVILLASDDSWRYRTLSQLPANTLARIGAERQYENVTLKPLGLQHVENLDATSSLFKLPAEYGGDPVLAVQRTLAGSDWKVVVLLDLAEVAVFRFWVQVVVALMAMTLAFLALYLFQRRRATQIDRAARAALAAANSALESEVQSRTQDLIEANSRLRATQDELVHSAKLAAVGQIAAGVSHELNQPMAAIRSLADNANVFLARGQNEGVTGNLRLISDLIDRMSGITTQLKLFARKRPSVLAAVPVRQTIAESLMLLDEKIRRTGAHIVEDYAAREIYVRADRDRLGQVFVNVLSNALDAMASDPSPSIEIATLVTASGVSISIRDNGPGFSPDVLQRIFEPFFTTKLAGSGLGLGLAISERIMRDFGGVLRAENAAGGGALFILQLPQADAAFAEAS